LFWYSLTVSSPEAKFCIIFGNSRYS